VMSVVGLVSIVYSLPILVGTSAADWHTWDDGAYPLAARAIAGNWLADWVAVSACFGTIGVFNSLLGTSALACKGMADMGFVPSCLSKMHPRFGTPVRALLLNAVVTGVICYFPFDLIIQVGMFLYSISLFLEWASVIVLRITEPELHRPFRICLPTAVLAVYFTIPMGLCVFSAAIAPLLVHEIVAGVLVFVFLYYFVWTYFLQGCCCVNTKEPERGTSERLMTGPHTSP